MAFPFKALLCDWAYTLVDLGVEDDRSALARVFGLLEKKGRSPPNFEKMYREFHEDFFNKIEVSRKTYREVCFGDILESHLSGFKIDLDGKINLNEIIEVYFKEIYSSRKVYPEVIGALKKLKKAGVRMGIVSNTTNPAFMKDYERQIMGMDPYFEFSVYSSETIWRKPHPNIFHEAIGKMGLEPKEILFVGDHLKMDVEGAAAVGMRTAWLNRNNAPLQEGIAPDYILKSFSDLLEISSLPS